jgi:hypothetical protein
MDPVMLFNDVDWHGPRGESIRERTYEVYEDGGVDAFVEFFGVGVTVVKTKIGDYPGEFLVPLEANSLLEAYSKFPTVMNEKSQEYAKETSQRIIDQLQSQMKDRSNQIIVPN